MKSLLSLYWLKIKNMSKGYSEFISKITKNYKFKEKGNVILICGNGGSSSQAESFTGEAGVKFLKINEIN